MILPLITGFTANIGGPAFLVAIALVIHAIFPFDPLQAKRVEPSWWLLAPRFVLEAASIFVWLLVVLPLLAWSMLFGDQDHWFYHYAWVFAAIISISVTTVATIRTFRIGESSIYLWIHLLVPIALLAAFGIVMVHEETNDILAATAEEAAQKIFAEMAPKIGEPVTLLANTDELPSELTSDGRKVFWIMAKNEPRARFSVIPHHRYGWRRADWSGFPPSDKELTRAKEWIKENRDGASAILQNIILNYPNTPAQAEARELFKSIESKRKKYIDEGPTKG